MPLDFPLGGRLGPSRWRGLGGTRSMDAFDRAWRFESRVATIGVTTFAVGVSSRSSSRSITIIEVADGSGFFSFNSFQIT